jgi:hypothetical protein
VLTVYKQRSYYDQELALGLLNTNFESIATELFDICFFYSIPAHKLDLFDWSDRRQLLYWDYVSGTKVETAQIVNFDCFQYTWFILQKLAEYGIIKSPIDKYIPYYLSIQTYKIAVESGYLVPLNADDSGLTSGFMFYLDSSDGWDAKGFRHACFYVSRGETVFIFENLLSKGTSWEALSKQEFLELHLGKQECYISSNIVV